MRTTLKLLVAQSKLLLLLLRSSDKPPIRAIDAPVAGELKGMIREKENRLSRQQCATPGSCLAPIHAVIRLLY
jgi:hypothetical protein